MCSQTRNSCAKAFDNRSRSKNLKPKKSRGGQFDPPPLKASRVNQARACVEDRVGTGYARVYDGEGGTL